MPSRKTNRGAAQQVGRKSAKHGDAAAPANTSSHIEARLRVEHHLAKPELAPIVSDTTIRRGQRDGDFQRAEKVGHGARNTHFAHHVEACWRRAHAGTSCNSGSVVASPGGDVNDNREERDQESGEDGGIVPMPNQMMRDRHHRHLGTALNAIITG